MNQLRFWTAVRDYAATKVRSSYMDRHGHERRCPNCQRWTSETMGSGPTREDGDHQWMVCKGCGHESRWLMVHMLPILDEPGVSGASECAGGWV